MRDVSMSGSKAVTAEEPRGDGARRASAPTTTGTAGTIWTPQPHTHLIHADTGAGQSGPALLWRLATPTRAIASTTLGGGIRPCAWVLNAQVRADYSRMDPAVHLQAIATAAGLDPDGGVGLLTAARVESVATAHDGGVRVDATVGVSFPTWASAADGESPCPPWHPGTINIVCQIPAPLSDAALVGAVITVTEAKAQALADGGVPGTGTASDAVVVCCPATAIAPPTHRDAAALPASGRVPFAGPRSVWGARLARAVYRAVGEGLADYINRAARG